MGLVVEEVRDQHPGGHAALAPVHLARVAGDGLEPAGLERLRPGQEPLVELLSRGSQRLELGVDLLAESGRLWRIAREAGEPREVSAEEVIERGVDRAEEGATVAPALFVRHVGAARVEALVHPAIVGSHHDAVVAVDHLLPRAVPERAYRSARADGRWPPQMLLWSGPR
jgi:hypothetical protein